MRSTPYLIFVIFFTLTHFESWKFYTRKVRKFTTNGAQSSNFLVFFWIFLHSAKNFTLTAFPVFLTNIRYGRHSTWLLRVNDSISRLALLRWNSSISRLCTIVQMRKTSNHNIWCCTRHIFKQWIKKYHPFYPTAWFVVAVLRLWWTIHISWNISCQ